MIFYKKKYLMIGGLSLFFFTMLLLFLTQSIKKTPMYITFSKDSGFYEEPFELIIEAGDREIFYTLDGSKPDRSSLKYEEPIVITDASKNANVHSMRTDVSGGFETEKIESMGYISPGFQTPNYLIDKATIIRAVAYDHEGQSSEILTGTYFVGFNDKKGYDNMNILSIVTDPDNLFNYDTGIYVLGKTYDEYKHEYRDQGIWNWREEFWSAWLGNFNNRGKKWEREAVCQFFSTDRHLILSQISGIRTHGAFSRGANPKSLNIYARKEYDGNKVFMSELFNNDYLASKVTLFQGGQDATLMKDVLIANAVSNLDISVMSFEPYVLFLDGEYWGMYWLNDKYDENYLEYHYDVGADNVILVKSGALETGNDDDYMYYENMLKFCSESDMTKEENYSEACRLIDIDSYTDYYAMMLYIGRNSDWPEGNYACWRVAKEENSPFGDGKWRWMVFDLNSAGFDKSFDSMEYIMENDVMFQNMMQNDEFRLKLITRMEELADTIFSEEEIVPQIEELQIFMTEPMYANNKRFYGKDSMDSFYDGVDVLKEFFKERKEILLPMIDEYR